MSKKITGLSLLIASILIAGYLFVLLFRYLPVENTSLGLDWRTIWNGIHQGQVTFGNTQNTIGGMFTPPWGILFLIPLGFLSFRDSWGIISFISTVFLVVSVPKIEKRVDIVGIILLVISFPSLRNLADGNIGGVVVGGIALVILGYNNTNPYLLSLGILLATIKPQETWLFCFLVFYLVIKKWSILSKLRVFALVGSVVVCSMLFWGAEWLTVLFPSRTDELSLSPVMGRGTLIDITVSAALGRLGMPTWFILVVWGLLASITMLFLVRYRISRLSWETTTFLIAASVLLAPYSSGNSFLTIVAVGVIPLLQHDKYLGAILLVLVNSPYFVSREVLINYQSYYWSLLLLVIWGIAGQRILSSYDS